MWIYTSEFPRINKDGLVLCFKANEDIVTDPWNNCGYEYAHVISSMPDIYDKLRARKGLSWKEAAIALVFQMVVPDLDKFHRLHYGDRDIVH